MGSILLNTSSWFWRVLTILWMGRSLTPTLGWIITEIFSWSHLTILWMVRPLTPALGWIITEIFCWSHFTILWMVRSITPAQGKHHHEIGWWFHPITIWMIRPPSHFYKMMSGLWNKCSFTHKGLIIALYGFIIPQCAEARKMLIKVWRNFLVCYITLYWSHLPKWLCILHIIWTSMLINWRNIRDKRLEQKLAEANYVFKVKYLSHNKLIRSPSAQTFGWKLLGLSLFILLLCMYHFFLLLLSNNGLYFPLLYLY